MSHVIAEKTEAQRERAKRDEQRAQLVNDLEQITQNVHRLFDVREEIKTVEMGGEVIEASTSGARRGFASPVNVTIKVPKSDVVEQLRVIEAELMKTFEGCMNRVAKYVEAR